MAASDRGRGSLLDVGDDVVGEVDEFLSEGGGEDELGAPVEVRADSDQLAGWQSRADSCLYHYYVRQTWTVTVGDRLVIQKLVAAEGGSPSPIAE